jgi:peroxiredoxin Q/BCP
MPATRSSSRTKATSTTIEKPKVEKKKESKGKAEPIVEEASSGALKVGDKVPEGLTVQLQTGESSSISALSKDTNIVIFFYPKANTPGCTKQACGFRDNYEVFEKAGYKVYGMSADSPKSQTTFKTKFNFQYDLLSDTSYAVIKRLGVLKAPKGIKRSHIIINKGGIIADTKIQVSPAESVDQAVEFVKQ